MNRPFFFLRFWRVTTKGANCLFSGLKNFHNISIDFVTVNVGLLNLNNCLFGGVGIGHNGEVHLCSGLFFV